MKKMNTIEQQKTKRKKRSTYEVVPENPSPTLEAGFFYILNANNGNGKTTYLSNVARYELRRLNLDESSYVNLICLSGTAFDRFDRYATFIKYLSSTGNKNTFYYYTGYTSNNNTSSLQTPFRILFEVLNNYSNIKNDYDFESREIFIASKFNELGFDTKFTVLLQEIESSHGKKPKKDECIVDFKIKGIKELINTMRSKKLEIQDIHFYKQGSKFSIYELSSGEYTFLRALFVLSLAIQEKSLVIYDEPENSLHPEWQSRLIKYIIEIYEKFGKKATILLATHSPLITASISYKNVKISEYDANSKFSFNWVNYEYYGWPANLVLTDQFNLESARSIEFINEFNEVLRLYIKNDWVGLEEAINKLDSRKVHLSDRDSLSSTYEAIKKELGKYKDNLK